MLLNLIGDYKGVKFQDQVNIVITHEVEELLYNYREMRMKLFREGKISILRFSFNESIF